eukprot:CAMPEP_0204835074 /NCGR_PEP_ID=MMETSP1346-20131115/21557_1 /ASSEMBLY_ACC=CAM_ASM_000771 /TAXON_ID=215587 /ORGANISM="Aplanochytrium stocchinoi, Strain GSBS06" /LENGTH=272 /DNA_ID=CAMNT_0051968777 /DNA_START=348 /DNA_END=1169 /DNA_ORIENTATION=+
MVNADTQVHDNSILLGDPVVRKNDEDEEPDPLVLLVLNTQVERKLFRSLWKRSAIRICADGGANRLYDEYSNSKMASELNECKVGAHCFIPDYVRGDLDSIRSEVAQFYADLGTKIEKVHDQDSNDMEKCLDFLQRLQAERNQRFSVVALGSFGGRFDQTMANLNAAYKWNGVFSNLVLISTHSLGFLLSAGSHKIIINKDFETTTCGLLPIGTPSESVTTKGLKWNLNKHKMEFGKLISSSNEVVEDFVLVETSHPIFWCTDLKYASSSVL